MYPITNKDSRDCKQTPLIEPDGFQVHAISLVQKELAGRGGSGIGLINTFSMELEASPQTGRIRRYSGMQPGRDHQAQGRATFAECSGNRVILSTVRAPPDPADQTPSPVTTVQVCYFSIGLLCRVNPCSLSSRNPRSLQLQEWAACIPQQVPP